MPVRTCRPPQEPRIISLKSRLNGATAVAAGIVALGVVVPALAQVVAQNDPGASVQYQPNSVQMEQPRTAPQSGVNYGTSSGADTGYTNNLVKPALKDNPAEIKRQGGSGIVVNGGDEVAQPRVQVDERPLWSLFNDRHYDELNKRIAQIKDAHPDWKPSSDLTRAMGGTAVRDNLDKALARKDLREALELKAKYPDQFDCGNIGNVWTVARIAALTGQTKVAAGLYKGLLATCTSEPDRIQTIEFYGQNGGYDEAYQMLGQEASRVTAQADLNALASAVTVLDVGHFTALVYANKLAQAKPLAPRLSALIVATHNIDGIDALGWLEMKQNRPADAIPWFTRALALQPGAAQAVNLAQAYVGAGQYDKAEQLAAKYPNAPQFAPIRRGLIMDRVQTAYKAGRYDDVLMLADAARKQGIETTDLALMRSWSLYQLGRPDASDSFIELAVANANTPAVADQAANGLLYSMLQQCTAPGSPTGTAPLNITDPMAGLPAIPANSAANDPNCMAKIVDRRGKPVVDGILQAFAKRLLNGRPDGKSAIALGWYSVRAGDLDGGLQWFSRAQKWSKDPDTIKQAKAGFAETLRALARKANDEKRFADSNAYLKAAGAISPDGDGDTMLASWNNYNLHNYAQARAGFQSVYVRRQDTESAQGLVAVAEAQGDLDSLDHLSGPIQPMVRGGHSDEAYNRGQFLSALRLSPERHPELVGIDAPVTIADVTYRDKSGTPGQGQLRGPTFYLAQTLTLGDNEWRVSVKISDLDSGTGRNTSGGNTLVPGGKTGTVVEPQIDWRHRVGNLEYEAALGTTPVGGVLAPTPTAKVAATYLQKNGGRVGLAIQRKGIDESVLSISGVHDATTGQAFGRVAETSVKATTYQPLGHDWGLSSGLEFGVLDGEHVRENSKIGFDLSVAKNIAPLFVQTAQRFSYISVGPQYSFESFQHNLDGYVIGQGGYFSPQYFHQFGAGVSFQTRPVGKLVARGGGFLGYQISHEDSRFLNGIPQSANDGSDLGGSVYLELSYLVQPGMFLDAGISHIATPTYSDTTARLGVHVPFRVKRRAVTTDDLPSSYDPQ